MAVMKDLKGIVLSDFSAADRASLEPFYKN